LDGLRLPTNLVPWEERKGEEGKLKLWPADVSRLAAGLFILVLSLPKVTQPLAKNKNKDQPTASQALIINFGEEQP